MALFKELSPGLKSPCAPQLLLILRGWAEGSGCSKGRSLSAHPTLLGLLPFLLFLSFLFIPPHPPSDQAPGIGDSVIPAPLIPVPIGL